MRISGTADKRWSELRNEFISIQWELENLVFNNSEKKGN
jgi:hypothetical protein